MHPQLQLAILHLALASLAQRAMSCRRAAHAPHVRTSQGSALSTPMEERWVKPLEARKVGIQACWMKKEKLPGGEGKRGVRWQLGTVHQ